MAVANNDNDQAITESNAVNPTEVRAPVNYYNEDDQNLNNKSDDFGFTRIKQNNGKWKKYK